MYNIVVIGAGQLGSRHIQSIKSTHHQCKLYVVDSVRESLEKTKTIYESTQVDSLIQEVFYCEKSNSLPEVIDLLLISTGSRPRAAIFKDIASHYQIKNVVFEKVLFQKESDYQEVDTILKDKGINAWVNCPRRMYEGYKALQPLFKGKTVNMTVNGGLWGMGCNSIHFLDVYSFLTGSTEYSLSTDGVDHDIIDSKRAGYKEFTGTLTAYFANGGTVVLHSANNAISHLVTLNTDDTFCCISEVKKECWIKSVERNEVVTFPVPYQSQLTSIVLDSILDNGSCELATYEESAQIHLPLIKGLIAFLNKNGIDTDNCPIT